MCNAEAAQARVAFSKREIEIKIEKAHLQAALEALEKEREAEAALAEAAVIEAAVANLDNPSDYKTQLIHKQSPQQWTEQYVSEHSYLSSSRLSLT